MSVLTKTLGAAALVAASAGAWAAHGGGSVYSTKLHALNNSGVSGDVVIAFTGGNQMRVIVTADGLEPNQDHVQHLHGEGDADAVCPDIAADTDADNLITVPEGAPAYGPILLGLGPAPSVGGDGRLRYAQTFVLGEGGLPALADLGAIDSRAIVVHGLTVAGAYDPALPVACGELTRDILLTPEPTPTPAPSPDMESGDGGSGALDLWLMLAALGLAGLVGRRRG